MWRLHPALVCLPAVLLLTCCALPGTRASGADEHVWLLGAAPEPGPAVPGPCPALRVAVPQAAPGYGSSRMAYRKDPLQLEYFVHHRWADAPTLMLAPALVGALERSGRFRVVLGADVQARSALLLETQDLRVEQLFDKAGSQVRLSARLSLVDLANQRVLGTREISVTEPAAAASPEAGAAAANRALPKFLREAGLMLDQSLKGAAGLCPAVP